MWDRCTWRINATETSYCTKQKDAKRSVVAQAYLLLLFTVLLMWSDMSAALIALAKALILRRFCREDSSFQLVFEGSFECELANDQNLLERLEDAIKRISVRRACICRISRGSYAVNLWCSNQRVQRVPIKPFVIIIDARASTWLWMTLVYFFSRFSRDPRSNFQHRMEMGLGPAKWGWALHL